MIPTEKMSDALRALHDIMVKARQLAGDGDLESLYRLMDVGEYLPKLLLTEEDASETFQMFLHDISITVPSSHYIAERFGKNELW